MSGIAACCHCALHARFGSLRSSHRYHDLRSLRERVWRLEPSVEQLAVHYASDGGLLHAGSEDGQRQLAANKAAADAAAAAAAAPPAKANTQASNERPADCALPHTFSTCGCSCSIVRRSTSVLQWCSPPCTGWRMPHGT